MQPSGPGLSRSLSLLSSSVSGAIKDRHTLRERLAHGQRISRRHCSEASNRVEYYWKPYFGSGTVALRWSANSEIISKNPAEGLMGFSGKHIKRGALTDSEVEQLFALNWPDKHSKLANMLAAAVYGYSAMSTGLRAGEILALQVRDMGSAMAESAKDQILVQSSTAMLAQASTRPQSVLQLFK